MFKSLKKILSEWIFASPILDYKCITIVSLKKHILKEVCYRIKSVTKHLSKLCTLTGNTQNTNVKY